MIRSLDPAADRFLTDLGRIQKRIERAQDRVSSGRRIRSASDDPDNVSKLLQLRTELAQTVQIKSDLGRIQLEVETAENALASAVRTVERARVLGVQGATDTQTAETRLMIAGEVRTLLEQLVALSATAVDDRYIFSGDNDQVRPYEYDLTYPNGVSYYAGAQATRQTRHPSGTLFSIARTAQDIFDNQDDPTKNVFAAVNGLRTALEANDTAAIQTALASVATAHRHLNSELAYYGTALNQVRHATDFAGKQELRLREILGELQDDDPVESILELTNASDQKETALQVRGSMPKKTLFDYLF